MSSSGGGGDTLVRAKKRNGFIIALVSAGVAFIGVAEVYITHRNTNKDIVAQSPDFARILHGEPEIVRTSYLPKDFDKSTANKRRSFSSFFARLGKTDDTASGSQNNRRGMSVFEFLRKKPERK